LVGCGSRFRQREQACWLPEFKGDRVACGFHDHRANCAQKISPYSPLTSPGAATTPGVRGPRGGWSTLTCRGPQCRLDFFARSLARRAAVRFRAAASDAFFARADRSSGVEFRAAFLPPCLPNSRAISVIAARTAAGIFALMPSMIHLTGYGEGKCEIVCDYH
jgi:hypothetical protein